MHTAYLDMVRREFPGTYLPPYAVPMDKWSRYVELEANLQRWFERALRLGWRPPDEASEERYLQTVKRARAARQ